MRSLSSSASPPAASQIGPSFSLALGNHPVVPAVAFGFGLLGRRLVRHKAWIAGLPAKTFASNALALQIAMAATGLALVFRVPLAELAGRTLYPGSVKNGSSRPSST